MDDDRQHHYRKWDRVTLAVVGLVTFAVTAAPIVQDRSAEWRRYQADFRNLVAERYGTARADAIPRGPQQIWVAPLQRVDRCTTCHRAIFWKGFEQARQPFRTHPSGVLRQHPPERFGCTTCHGGQGYALERTSAHGEIENWDEPLLGSRLSKRLHLRGVNRNALIQVNCNACHRNDRETKGAESINLAKRVFENQPCGGCHLLNGEGGTVGPDLTYVGDKPADEFDFSHVKGIKSAYGWHVAHFKNPPDVVRDTTMPNLDLTDEEAQALAMLMLSWRKVSLPEGYRPGCRPIPPSASESSNGE